MGKSLIITEKPSVAQEFAKVLGVSGGRRDGYLENQKYVITWCVGHLVAMVYPESYDIKYKKWKLEDLPFLPKEYKYDVIKDVSRQYDVVHGMLMREDIDRVYWAGDAGKEGQTIEENIRNFGGVRDGMEELRVWIDSQTEEEIQRGIREAKPMSAYENLGKSGIMRTIEDYAMGINFSRVMQAYAQWYKEGIIDPEFTTKDLEKMLQGEISSSVGVSPYYQYWGYDPGPNVVQNLGADAIFEPYEIPSANGGEVKASVTFANYGYIVVSKGCKNPEAVLKLLNFYAHVMDEGDEEDADFINELFGNAYTNIPYALRVINPNTDYNQFVKVSGALEKGLDEDPAALGKDGVKYSNSVDFIKEGASTGVGDYLQQGGPKAAYRISKEIIDNEQYIKDAMWGPATETLLSAGSTLDDILTEGFTKIIVGEESIDYFDTLVDNWAKAGGTKATEEINETYGNN